MLGFGKKGTMDPKEALDKADKTLNKGVMGFMTKTFMGKGFVDTMNQAVDQGRGAMDQVQMQQELLQSGVSASAEVMSIQDTGQLINYNPVVIMQLKVKADYGGEFDTTTQMVVSKIAVPRVGDTIQIKYDPADTSKVAIV